MDGNAPTDCEKGHSGKSNHNGYRVKANILDQSKQKSKYKLCSHEKMAGRKVAGKE